MIVKDYYKILDLGSNKVSIEQIKTAYREMAKKYHPDLNVGDRKSEERFKDITEAYNVLSDTVSRRKYDRIWNSHIGNKKIKKEATTTGNSDIFSIFFGNVKEEKQQVQDKKNKKAPAKGENLETEINVTIEEAFYGKNKKISLRTVDGKMKTFDVNIPAGIRDKEKIRLLGQGKQGKNGGKNGDLFIKINITNNANFILQGTNIKTYIPITPWEAALGARINVKGIDEDLSISVAPGTSSGEKIEIPQKGYKDGKGSRGNLIIETKIQLPKKIPQQEKIIYEQLKEISKHNPRK